MPQAKVTKYIIIRRNPLGRLIVTYHGATAGNGQAPVARCASVNSAKGAIKRFGRQFGKPQEVFGRDLLEMEGDQGPGIRDQGPAASP